MYARYVVVLLTATLARAVPGGWEGYGGHQSDRPYSYGHGGADGLDCDSTEPAKPVYTAAQAYTKPPESKEYPTPTSTFTCPTTCRLIYHGTFLQYPTVIAYTSVYSETINAFVTEYGDGSPGQTVEETVTAPPGPPAAPTAAPLTWTYSGVTLTYPTTYVAYFSIAYATLIPLPAQSTCSSKSAPLDYPRVWPSLIADSTSIRQPGNVPPATIVAWIDSLPTVRQQLGGHICDPVFGGLQPFVPTATVTSATTIAGNTRIVQTTTVSAAAVTSAPPPPAPPSPPSTTSFVAPLSVPPASTTRSVVLQTVNAAARPGQAGVGSWIGNIIAALFVLV